MVSTLYLLLIIMAKKEDILIDLEEFDGIKGINKIISRNRKLKKRKEFTPDNRASIKLIQKELIKKGKKAKE